MEIAPYRQAVQAGLFQLPQIAVQEIDPVGIVDIPVQEDPVVAALSVLCDIDGNMVALKDQTGSPVEYFGSHRPFEGRAGIARIFFLHDILARLILHQTVAVIDIEAGEIDRRGDDLQILPGNAAGIGRPGIMGIVRIMSQKNRVKKPLMVEVVYRIHIERE